jgi:pentatricopeptide repeat protein
MTPAKSSRLAEINLEMKRVLDNAAVRNLTARTTVTHILKLAQELRESGESFNTETYEHILSAYAKAGDSRQTLVLYKQMMAHGINPSRTFFHKALQVCAKFVQKREGL